MRNVFVWRVVVLTVFLSLCTAIHAQIYKFRQFGINEGVCHHSIYAVTQDKHGFIWFASGTGLCYYDGFHFTSPDVDLPQSNVTAAFQDREGNLWFGYSDGYVIQYDGYGFSVVDTSQNSPSINQIIQAPDGEILAATQNEGITRIEGEHIERLSKGLEDKLVYSLCFAGDSKLFIGCQDGLYLFNYKKDRPDLVFAARVDSIPDAAVRAIIPKVDGSGYWVATEDYGIYSVAVEEEGFIVRPLEVPGLDEASVQALYEDTRNNLWISTFGKGLFRVHLSMDATAEKTSNYNSTNGLGSDYVKQVFFDNQQNLWVGTYGDGVASLTNLAFSFFETIESIANNATALFSADNSEYWVAGTGSVVRIESNPEYKITVLGHANGIPNDRINTLHLDESGTLWIGTEKSGLYRLDKGTGQAILYYRSENSLSNTIQAITSSGTSLWLASRNGVLMLDTQTGKAEQFNTASDLRLPHNNVRDIYKDSKGVIWIATNSNSILAVNQKDRKYVLQGGTETEFSSITEDREGNLWAGTLGNGIYFFDSVKDTIYHFNSQTGLKSDFCYAVAFDGKDHVWVGHRLGISRINTKRHTIITFGTETGIAGDVNPNAIEVNRSGEVLIGLTDGVMVYDMNADRTHNQPPMLSLTGVSIGDKRYNPHEPVILPYGHYRVRFDFIGLQFSNPESVAYQYVLKGYDTEWSSPSKTGSAMYPRLEDGEYQFYVKACNSSDNCTEEIMLLTLRIRKPFWKTWWFILLVFVALAGLGYMIIFIRERNHRIQQEYLERELVERTKEVREQKEEIEAKNRDITDSINYAQRIQFSVLPTTSALLEHCSGAFIFYRPRDIVSGDFYWFNYLPDPHILLIVCADSTGHGVPGAFMSLIGTTLIKDIAMRPDVHSPSDILYRLDADIQSTLNQNRDSEQANDGMDLVVCAINTQTHIVKIASAMRPFIIYHDGVPVTYKCNRASIGGHRVENKVFDVTEVQLSVGDVIYMFTDGYTDQFGGPAGKKFKMNRLQSILDDIHDRDMDEQHRVIRENFDLWKGNLEQVDDVLMIGIRV